MEKITQETEIFGVAQRYRGSLSRHVVSLPNWSLRLCTWDQTVVGWRYFPSPENWRASYWEFLFSGFDCGTLNNLNEEPRSVLQDGSVSS